VTHTPIAPAALQFDDNRSLHKAVGQRGRVIPKPTIGGCGSLGNTPRVVGEAPDRTVSSDQGDGPTNCLDTGCPLILGQ
jgi:hypothetical protein